GAALPTVLSEAGDVSSLHSFPTRRSSDLPQLPQNADCCVVVIPRSLARHTHLVGTDVGSTPVFSQRWRTETNALSAIAPSPRRRSEEHTPELQPRGHLVCRLLLE